MLFDTRWLFLALIVAVAAERLVEMILTRRNAARLRARGGHPVGDEHFPWMVLLHVGLLIAAPVEVFALDRPFVPPVGYAALAVVAGTMALRYWVIHTLGDRWTTRIFVVPGEPPVTGGPFRYLRHPNYLAVVLEVAALPLVHCAWWTALVGSVANAAVLWVRIRTEEAALEQAAGYHSHLGDRALFWPTPGTRPRDHE